MKYKTETSMHHFTKVLLLCFALSHANIAAQIGIYTVQGNLTLTSGASTEIQLKNTSGAGSGNDQITALGNLTLSGALSVVLDGYSPNLSNSFEIASYTGTLAGTFSSIVWPTGMTSGWSIDYGVIVPGKVTIFGSQNPLPVDFVNLKGSATDRGNELSWQTTGEAKSDYFSVEWSENGGSFVEVGQVRTKINSISLQNYSFLHADVKDAINYYRLKQIDHDGSVHYSSIIKIDRKGQDILIHFYPNPTSGMVQFSTGVDQITIYDNAGRVVLEASNIGTSLDISYLPLGTYYISINQATTTQLLTKNK